MFSYVDEKIRKKLENDSRLVHLDQKGTPVPKGSSIEPFISILGPITLPLVIAGKEYEMDWYPFVHRVQLGNVLEAASAVSKGNGEALRELLQTHMSVNSVVGSPGFLEAQHPLVRLHSCCLTGEVFGSMRCECGPQLESAFCRIVKERGALVYMTSHEGRGIGLWAKAVTYLLQDDGQDTYQANVTLGLPEDSRDFSDAAIVLRYLLNGRAIRLLSNNPLKKRHLENNGQSVIEMVSHVAGVCKHNLRYIRSKKNKGHQLPDL